MSSGFVETAVSGASRGAIWGGGAGVVAILIVALGAGWTDVPILTVVAIVLYGMIGVVAGCLLGAIVAVVALLRQKRRSPIRSSVAGS
jgi:hypothetical protein